MIELGESKVQQMLNNYGEKEKYEYIFSAILKIIDDTYFYNYPQKINIFYDYIDDEFTTEPTLGSTFFVNEFNIKMYLRNKKLSETIDDLKNSSRLSKAEFNNAIEFLNDFIFEKLKAKILKDSTYMKTEFNYFNKWQLLDGYVAFDELSREQKMSIINYVNESRRDITIPKLLEEFYDDEYPNLLKEKAISGDLNSMSDESIFSLSEYLNETKDSRAISSIVENNEINRTFAYDEDDIKKINIVTLVKNIDFSLFNKDEFSEIFVEKLETILNYNVFVIEYFGELGLIYKFNLKFNKTIDCHNIKHSNAKYSECFSDILVTDIRSGIMEYNGQSIKIKINNAFVFNEMIENNNEINVKIHKNLLIELNIQLKTLKNQLEYGLYEVLSTADMITYKAELIICEKYINYLNNNATVIS